MLESYHYQTKVMFLRRGACRGRSKDFNKGRSRCFDFFWGGISKTARGASPMLPPLRRNITYA
jgi:hypothetical protein